MCSERIIESENVRPFLAYAFFGNVFLERSIPVYVRFMIGLNRAADLYPVLFLLQKFGGHTHDDRNIRHD
ncbi:MAG: hypothetical protein PWQ12_868 [Clostridiales bacterium]|nr:hypothetical protein [Clostridiales bacterium]